MNVMLPVILVCLVLGTPAMAWDLRISGWDPWSTHYVKPAAPVSIQVCADKQLADFALKKLWLGAKIPIAYKWQAKGEALPSQSWPGKGTLPLQDGLMGPFPDGRYCASGFEVKVPDFPAPGTWDLTVCITSDPSIGCTGAHLHVSSAVSKPGPPSVVQAPASPVLPPGADSSAGGSASQKVAPNPPGLKQDWRQAGPATPGPTASAPAPSGPSASLPAVQVPPGSSASLPAVQAPRGSSASLPAVQTPRAAVTDGSSEALTRRLDQLSERIKALERSAGGPQGMPCGECSELMKRVAALRQQAGSALAPAQSARVAVDTDKLAADVARLETARRQPSRAQPAAKEPEGRGRPSVPGR
jgi:hypothetical protein